MRESQSRRLAAILAADIAGYSALMGVDEARTVRDLKGHQAVVLPLVGEFGGRIIDTAGDGILAEFASVVNAVKCAVTMQSKMAERNAAIEPACRLQFRIGINIGEVIYDETRIYGDGINVAARLEGIAEPGGICISSKVYEEISGRIDLACQDIGEQQLKNIARPVRTYRVSTPAVRIERDLQVGTRTGLLRAGRSILTRSGVNWAYATCSKEAYEKRRAECGSRPNWSRRRLVRIFGGSATTAQSMIFLPCRMT
jgi:class 3 adenylate cyclase